LETIMTNDILIRSTAKNWIVSIRKTNARGEIATAPVATIPRRAYAAAALAGAVTATQKLFMVDNVMIDTDRDGVHLLASLGIIEAQIAAKAYEMADRGDALQNRGA
jgi:hypothetical protein